MRLTGWVRLWIFLSGILLLVIAAASYVLLPSASDVPDSPDLQEALSADARAQMAVGEGPDTIGVQMPNGHTIYLTKGIDPKRSTLALAEYNSEIERRLLRKRMSFLASAAAIWLSICAATYALGWSLGWVYQGFRGGSDAL